MRREWGIAAFTGRRPDAALALAAQDGLFTVVERADAGDSFSVVGSIVEAVDGADVDRLAALLAARATAVVTLTITEAGYLATADGGFDAAAPEVAADLAALRGPGRPVTPLGRLVLGLAARRAAAAGPLAVVCCDNLSHNGTVARNAVLGMAGAWEPALAEWIVTQSASSARPWTGSRPGPRQRTLKLWHPPAATGTPLRWSPNPSPAGSSAGNSPRAGRAGKTPERCFVEDIEPYENRKLWLLNGAHSLLAYAGQLRGHATVAQALADPACRHAVEAFWDEAEANLPRRRPGHTRLPGALLARFGNARIAHHLAQIAMDGTTKLGCAPSPSCAPSGPPAGPVPPPP